MNKNYRTIWNEALGAWVAASEIDSARGKPTKRAAIAIVAAPLILASQVALAQYSGGYLSNAQGGGSIAIGGNGASTNAYGNDDVAIGSGAGDLRRNFVASQAVSLASILSESSQAR
ncbi:ESPR domain-containing protein, partial [Burkholderia stagnalis]|uniref:ESPR domain-containing protein n=1 Tax=Burkholderia stagnalis TaxID=1503054 RepID=UPI000FC1EC72